jgi:hypothetical protein
MVWYMDIEEEPPRLTQLAIGKHELKELTIVALKTASRFRYLCRKSRRGSTDRSATVAAKPTAVADVIFGMNLSKSIHAMSFVNTCGVGDRT